MSDGLIWVLAGLALLIAEAVTPGVFMLWLGLAAIGTGLIALGADLAFGWHVAVFAALAAVSIAAGLRFRNWHRGRPVNAPGSGLVGRQAVVLSFHGDEGRVRVGDSDWGARLVKGTGEPLPGQVVRVTAVEGTLVVVQAE